MLKFLRKYNKFILVIGGSFLMVVFLLPQAIQQFGPNPMSVVHFRADGKTFRGRDIYEAGKELQQLQAIQQIAYQQTGVMVPLYFQDMDSTHWLLLVREAQNLGLIGGPESGRSYLNEIAELLVEQQFSYQQSPEAEEQKKQIVETIVGALRDGRNRVIDEGTPADMVDRTLAKRRAIDRLANLAGGIPSLSTREAAYFGRDFLDTAVADIVLIGVEDYEGQVPEPSEQELIEHFERYKSLRPAESEHSIGYLRPPAVRVEALQVDRSVIRNAITLDPVEVNKLWRQNQDRFGSSFRTAKPNVEAELRTFEVQAIMNKIEELIRREFLRATQKLPTLEGGFKELPEDWAERRPNYQVLAERINTLVGEELDLGQTQPATAIPAERWLDEGGLARHPAASATATVAGQRMNFPGLALSVRSLDPQSRTGVQEGLSFGPIEIPQYRLFYFRVLEARPQSPPDSLDEVYEEVRRDYLRLQAYERLLADRDEIRRQLVESEGFVELYERFPQGMTVREGMRITEESITPPQGVSPLPAANKPALREAVATLIQGWDPMRLVSDIPLEERIVSVPLPESLSLAFVIVKGHHPMTAEELRRNDFRVLQAAQAQWIDPALPNTFSIEALKARLNFQDVREDRGAEDEPEGEGEPPARDPNALTP